MCGCGVCVGVCGCGVWVCALCTKAGRNAARQVGAGTRRRVVRRRGCWGRLLITALSGGGGMHGRGGRKKVCVCVQCVRACVDGALYQGQKVWEPPSRNLSRGGPRHIITLGVGPCPPMTGARAHACAVGKSPEPQSRPPPACTRMVCPSTLLQHHPPPHVCSKARSPGPRPPPSQPTQQGGWEQNWVGKPRRARPSPACCLVS